MYGFVSNEKEKDRDREKGLLSSRFMSQSMSGISSTMRFHLEFLVSSDFMQ